MVLGLPGGRGASAETPVITRDAILYIVAWEQEPYAAVNFDHDRPS